jgi:hypothetical protein
MGAPHPFFRLKNNEILTPFSVVNHRWYTTLQTTDSEVLQYKTFGFKTFPLAPSPLPNLSPLQGEVLLYFS